MALPLVANRLCGEGGCVSRALVGASRRRVLGDAAPAGLVGPRLGVSFSEAV